MIAPNFVLTSRHCSVCTSIGNGCPELTTVALGAATVTPGYDKTLNPNSNVSSIVKKVYFPESTFTDVAILELEKPVGECSGWMSYGFNNDDAVFTNILMQKAGYPKSPQFIDLGFSGDELTTSKGFFDDISNPLQPLVQDHFFGQGGESGGPAFVTDNTSEYLIRGVLSGPPMRHQCIIPEVFYTFNNILENNSIQNGSCFDFPGACPDFADLTMPETNIQTINTNIQLILNESLSPTNRVYQSAGEILMSPGFELQPLNTTFLAEIADCPE